MSPTKKCTVDTITRVNKVNETPMNARYSRDFLVALCRIWPSKIDGRIGIKQAELAAGAKISTGTISKYFNDPKRKPDFEEMAKLDKFFKIISFCPDGMEVIDNDKVLEAVKAFWEENLPQKA